MNFRAPRWLTLLAALLVLDISLTFDNLWPTPAIAWHGELSSELAVVALAFAAIGWWRGRVPRALVAWTSALWVVLMVGRYAEVTSSALYGRDINLYWDLRYIPDVGRMIVAAAPVWLVAIALAVAAIVVGSLFLLARWALARLAGAAGVAAERRMVAITAASAVVLFAALQMRGTQPEKPWFPTPVTGIYARQLRFVSAARGGGRASNVLSAPEPPPATLDLVKDTDVLLVFIESYGSVSYDRPEIADRIRASRTEFGRAVGDTGRGVVSAFVESPTFGGSSWLAHLSLLSGVEVRTPDDYALLMTARRATAVTTFARRGFHTVAVMPGLKKSWPEGGFYGFDDIYDGERVEYRGPWFGWFGIPDQATLANLHGLQERQPPHAPLFVFLPTLSTHFPFGPTPPYQDDWRRILTDEPYDSSIVYDALADEPDWANFAPGYAKAVSYAFRSLGGYLRLSKDRDLVMILIGDHQPPAAVSREGSPWDVPVHVIASRREVLDRLVARGFKPGLSPERPDISKMHGLLPMLLDAFSSSPP